MDDKLYNINNLKISIYPHGGARIYLEDKKGSRQLICDIYGDKNNPIDMKIRDFIIQCIKKVLKEK